MKILLSLAAAVLLCPPQDKENPAFKYWSAWKIGAWSKYKTITESSGVKIEIETTTTLTEIGKEKLVVESSGKMTMAGRETPTAPRKQDIKLKDPKMGAIDKEGDEALESGGKTYKCHWILTSQESAGGKVTMKFWFAKEIPSGIVRSEVGTEGEPTPRITTVLVEFGEK
jgi:hypothetical protein